MNKKVSTTRFTLKKGNIIQAILLLSIIIAINILATKLYFRYDLTKEKRFSISPITKNTLSQLEDVVYIEVFLEDKNLPFELLRYRKSVKEFLENLCSYSNNIEFEFKNPFKNSNYEQDRQIYMQLYNKGLNPTVINNQSSTEISEKIIFAGAIVKYQDQEYPINLLTNNASTGDKYVGLSEAELEREFALAILKLSSKQVQKIAFIEDHGELDEVRTTDIMTTLSKYYQIDRVKMNSSLEALNDYAVVIIARPQKYFSEKDKFIIDQYIMRGGRVIWLVEWMEISLDSLSNKASTMAMIRDINLDDQLFNYGVRINPDLIQDLRCLKIPIYINTIDEKPQFEPRPWYYFPLIIPDTLLNHRLLRNLEPMRTNFVSSIDTVGTNPDIKKTILLRTSKFSKSLVHPIEVNLNILREKPELQTFSKPNLAIAVLLEGEFKSNYINRLSEEFYDKQTFQFIEKSKPTKMIVISDGNFIENEVKKVGNKKNAMPLGADKYYPEQYTPGNSQFIVNCVNYLCADDNIISLRMRDIKIRNLNETLVKQKMIMWVYINSIIPISIIITIGLIILFLRKIKYKRIIK